MATLYRKTEKGTAEIATRANRLPPKLRAALILVDGKRTDDELTSMILSEPESTLAWLTESGFIEVANKAANSSRWPASAQVDSQHVAGSIYDAKPDAARTTRTAAADNLPAGVGAINSIPDGPPASRLPIDRIKRESVRELTDLLGPMSEGIAIKIEKANSREELKGLLDIACTTVANTRGRGKAAEFSAKYIDGLMV